jgi:type I restriction enzyme, S subunit
MMKHLFTYGPVPPEDAMKVALKETEIGPVPEVWGAVKLEDIVRVKITDGVHKTPKYADLGIPFISAVNMENDSLNFLSCRCISPDDHQKLIQRCHPEFNDVLLCKVGATIGKVAKVDVNFPFSIFVQIALIKPNLSKIDPNFLKYALISEKGQTQILTNASQSTMPFIGTNKIGQILIPCPDIKIQKKIGAVLASIDQKLAAEQSRRQALDTMFTSLLHDLMTAKIRVNQVPYEISMPH